MDGKKIIVLLALLATTGTSWAQSIQDYFFKSWDLSYITPAALASDTSLIGNMSYGQDEVGGVNTNVGGQLQLRTGFESGHGVGVTIQSSRSGIFTGNSIGAGYAYRIRLSENQTLSAGGRFTYFKYSLDRSGVTYGSVDDPALYGDLFQQSSLLISTGFMYSVGQFRLVVNTPDVFPIEGTRYTKKRVSAYADYGFQANDWEIRPNFYFERLEALGNWYESGLYVSYRGRLAAEVGYTSENALRGKASVSFSQFTVGYGYNAGKTSKEGSESQIGNRLFIGYNFGNLFALSQARKAQELKEKEEIETILRDQVQLIDKYKSALNESEENYRNMLEQQVKAANKAKEDSTAANKEATQPVEATNKTAKANRSYYVSIATFDTMSRVNIFIYEYAKSLSPKVLYIPHEKKYRVYVDDNLTKFSKAVELRDKLRKQGYEDCWIFEIK